MLTVGILTSGAHGSQDVSKGKMRFQNGPEGKHTLKQVSDCTHLIYKQNDQSHC